MSKNPYLNALAANLYIVTIASFLFWGMKLLPREDSFLAPIAMISLFTLSAAIMGYLFCLTPIMLYIDGKKKQAVTFFLQTVLGFGVLTVIVFSLLFSRII